MRGLLLFAVGLSVAGGLACWYGAVCRRSQLMGRSVFRGAGTRRSIALTFDDGPSAQTPELTRFLAEQGVRATFFLCGVNVARHPGIACELAAQGHELGNHTWSHPRLCPRLGWRLNLVSPAAVLRQVAAAQAQILAATGVAPGLVRAPYGLRWWGMARAQRRFGLLHVLWTAIGHDWEWSADRVSAHVLRTARPGGIVCLHDGRDTRADPDISVTLEAVRQLVPRLKQQGYRFETVTELLRTDEEAAAQAAFGRVR